LRRYAGCHSQLSCSGKRTHALDFSSPWSTMTRRGIGEPLEAGKASKGLSQCHGTGGTSGPTTETAHEGTG
jgi:hypothetical protein